MYQDNSTAEAWGSYCSIERGPYGDMGAGWYFNVPITRVLLMRQGLAPLQGSPALDHTLNIVRADDGGSNSMYAG